MLLSVDQAVGVPVGGAAAVAADPVRAAQPRVLCPSRGRGVPMGRIERRSMHQVLVFWRCS